jgi:hypothetical protein
MFVEGVIIPVNDGGLSGIYNIAVDAGQKLMNLSVSCNNLNYHPMVNGVRYDYDKHFKFDVLRNGNEDEDEDENGFMFDEDTKM